MIWSRAMRWWVGSFDHAEGGKTYLVATSESEAQAAARRQDRDYKLDCVPVKVKP